MKRVYAIMLGGLLVPCIHLSAEKIEGDSSVPSERAEVVAAPLFTPEEFEADLSFLQEQETPSNPIEGLDLSSERIAFSAEIDETVALETPASKPSEAHAELPLLIDAIEVPSATALNPSVSQEEVALLNIQDLSAVGEQMPFRGQEIRVDLMQAFSGSPVIYSILIGMSVFALALWLYALTAIRVSMRLSPSLLRGIQNQLGSNHFEEALALSQKQGHLICKMLSSAIASRRYGLPIILETMKAEAKRSTISFWQKIGLLSDIAVIAPMLGLLGTVLGMFYAFYDVNRSIESISTLFDGLGISVGTTVAGLIVAILALILQSSAKYKLVRSLARIEREATQMATLLDDKTHIHRS